MATTTVPLIRAQLVATVEAVAPARLAEHPFRRHVQTEMLEESAEDGGSHLLRRFEIRQSDSGEEMELLSATQTERRERFTIQVAYPPLENLGGGGGLDGVRDMMREDYRLLRDALYSASSYLSGVLLQGPATATFEENEDLWWLVLELPVQFYEATSL